MSSIKTKPSRFPYAVMLAIMPVHLLFGGIMFYRVLHIHVEDDANTALLRVVTLAPWFVTLVYAATCGLACAQWFAGRQRLAGLPLRGVALVGLVYSLLAAALDFLVLILDRRITDHFDVAYRKVVTTLLVMGNLVFGRILTALCIGFALWLAFRLLRHRAMPAPPLVEYRWRALAIFTWLLWTWVLTVISIGAPVLLTMGLFYGLASPEWLSLGLYASSIGLILPGFIGAWLGLPDSMPAVRVWRLLLASVLVLLVCALVLVGVTYAMLCFGFIFDGSSPGLGFAACVSVLWCMVSTLLCWLLLKGLLRQRPAPLPAAGMA